MLASEQRDATGHRHRSSLASDIVELVVLTDDAVFLQTLREAVGASRRLWHVPTADKISDLLLAGEVGILVLDVHSFDRSAVAFIAEIKRQFPDLVILLAGGRDIETPLAELISSGTVYRFIHKPMSPERAKLFADSAVRKYEDQRRRALRPAAGAQAAPSRRGWWATGLVAACALLIGGTWTLQRYGQSEPPFQPAESANYQQTGDSPLLKRAVAALAANRLTAPSGDNALELFLQALARNPADPAARAGIGEVHERLCARAESALLAERLDEAAAAIETARAAGVESGRIALLSAELAKSRAQISAARIQARQRRRTESPVNREEEPGASP